MRIKWFGHSCFLLTSTYGTEILTDPFDYQVGYALPDTSADVVTTSHNHFDHAYIQAVKGTFLHLNEPGRYKHNEISFNGISTYHDEFEGKKRGRNIIFTIEIDGLRICHCGDLGHLLNKQQIGEIGKVDILMLPVGGTFTVDASEAFKVMKSLGPKVTIPMHFKTPELSFELDEVEKFINEAGLKDQSNVFIQKQEIDITKENIGSFPEIIVLNYSSRNG